MGRNSRRILNKVAAMRPGIREALDALNALNWAKENGVRDPKVDQAFDLLQAAADIWRDEACEQIDRAREVCEIKWPNILPQRRE